VPENERQLQQPQVVRELEVALESSRNNAPAYCDLVELKLHLAQYRDSLDAILASNISEPKEWRVALLNILVYVSRLYLDYSLFQKDIPRLWHLASKRAKRNVPRCDIQREQLLRSRIEEQLESSSCWIYFKLGGVASLFPNLQTLRDYTNSFALHLPEIYEETIRLDACATSFMETHDKRALADMVVGMQHMARNHISFVLPALELAADEDHWAV
jgi:hypothetical protein